MLFPLTYSRCVILIPQQDLGGRVGQRTTAGSELLSWLKLVAKAKVCKLDQALLLKEDHILRLQVSVHHVEPVAVRDCMHYLSKVLLCQLLIQALLVLHDVVKHVTPISQLQDQVQLGLGVNDLIETHNVGMLHQLHAADFLKEVPSCHGVKLGLVDDLDSHFFTSKDMACQLDHSKVPTSQCFVQVIESGDLAIIATLEACHCHLALAGRRAGEGPWGLCRQGPAHFSPYDTALKPMVTGFCQRDQGFYENKFIKHHKTFAFQKRWD